MLWIKTFLLVLTTEFVSSVDQDKCLAILHPTFDDCGTSGHLSHTDTKCLNSRICGDQATMTFVDVIPFGNILKEVMSNVFDICCGGCSRPTHHKNETKDGQSLTYSDIKDSTFVFPVFGRASETTIYGYHYIPVITMSSGYLITEERSSSDIMLTLITSCGNLWPLLVIMLLLALLAGFLVWIIETWVNREEFPRTFLVGLFDGFWWAFISMTTVGYGDKSPRFVVSRLFAVLWILIGITICSMFTASLTTEIDTAFNPDDPEMRGKTIGVLKYRTFDASFVAHHGGLIREAESIIGLKNLLLDEKVDGIFMDKFTYMHSIRLAKKYKDDEEHVDAADFFLDKTHKVKEIHDGETMSYGVLVKDESHYKFFQDIIEHNQLIFETCAVLQLNDMEIKDEGEHNVFSIDGGYFFPFLWACLGIIGGVLFFGLLYEVHRFKGRSSKVESES